MRWYHIGFVAGVIGATACAADAFESLPASYRLASIDGETLPYATHDLPPGGVILAADLEPTIGAWGPASGTVRLSRTTRYSGLKRIQQGYHRYVMEGSRLTIDLCPVETSCPEAPGVLTGEIYQWTDFFLTVHAGGRDHETYHYVQKGRD